MNIFRSIKIHRAPLNFFKKKAVIEIEREGIIYYLNSHIVLLNPEKIDQGKGILLIKPELDLETVGAYFIEGVNPTLQEENEARCAYLYAVGKPRRGMWVLPAYFFSECVGNDPENLQVLRDKGAWISNSRGEE